MRPENAVTVLILYENRRSRDIERVLVIEAVEQAREWLGWCHDNNVPYTAVQGVVVGSPPATFKQQDLFSGGKSDA